LHHWGEVKEGEASCKDTFSRFEVKRQKTVPVAPGRKYKNVYRKIWGGGGEERAWKGKEEGGAASVRGGE